MSEPMTYDWQQLATTWQLLPIDELRLRRSTRWKTWRMAANATLEVLVIFYVWAMTFWFWGDLHSVIWRSWLLLWCVLTPFFVAWSFYNKRGTWQSRDETTVALLMLRKQRAEAGIRYAKNSVIAMLSSAAMAVLFGVIDQGYAPAAEEMLWYRVWWPVIFVVAWLVFGAAITEWYRRLQQRKLAEVSKLLTEFDSRLS
ncbi:hypothetical protein [Permianibacter aggregans]|uniref:Uncharacterized protein n=1 Tax=Permianibacter aggregans TaxID=1510150 RepID=A0A4R6UTA3_9GAMM|nr:hypothetical protein [Permianibacter aggregans]QGX40375.1 hypothetical protein E2H98_12110 [Permianibacter aggregans]TDQ49496.1 hypothetical protein EV696_104202 [Permianibacter aggregans]